MNIIFSGWPGSGTTSLAILTAYSLGYKYLYAGGLMKYFAVQIVGEESGPKFVQFEQDFGNAWDEIWEKYAKWKITNTDHLIVEGKTLGFLMEDPMAYEIMLTATQEARAARAGTDHRLDPVNTIKARDQVVRARFRQTLDIDIFNPNEILMNYDLVIDNSELAISDELELVARNLLKASIIDRAKSQEIIASAKQLDTDFWKLGKNHYREELKNRGLLLDPQAVLTEWNISLNEDIEKLPVAMQTVVRSFQG